jgi:hypothetical protein
MLYKVISAYNAGKPSEDGQATPKHIRPLIIPNN